MPVIPEIAKLEAGGLWIQIYPVLHSKPEANLEMTVRHIYIYMELKEYITFILGYTGL